jgi:hypothetical protein
MHRPGHIGLFFYFQGASGWLKDIEDIIVFNRMLDLIVRHFRPTFAYGGKAFNTFVERYRDMAPPEERVWPFNIYDIWAYPDDLRQRLISIQEQGNINWVMRFVEDRYAILMHNDKTIDPYTLDGRMTDHILRSQGTKVGPDWNVR